MKTIIIVCFCLLLNNRVIAQKDYILFFRKNECKDSHTIYSSIIYIQSINPFLLIDQKDIIYLNDRYYILRFLKFPTSEMELMACCENDTMSWQGIQEYVKLRQAIGLHKADSIVSSYKRFFIDDKLGYKSLKKYRVNFNTKSQLYKVSIFAVQLDICKCSYENIEKKKWNPLLGYFKRIDKIRKLNRDEIEFFDKNLHLIMSWYEDIITH